MKRIFVAIIGVSIICGCSPKPSESTEAAAENQPGKRWTEQEANDWYKEKGWLIGSNFTPSTAINQLEMGQEEIFSNC